jgi:hypothetical protein
LPPDGQGKGLFTLTGFGRAVLTSLRLAMRSIIVRKYSGLWSG